MEARRQSIDLLNWLLSRGISYELIRHTKGKTTAEASRALGVDKSKILKSLLLKDSSEEFIGVVITGDRKVSFKKLKRITGSDFKLASCQEVLRETGYKVGGVPAFTFSICHITGYVDFRVMQHKFVYGSAGSETLGLKFSPSLLKSIGYRIVDITKK